MILVFGKTGMVSSALDGRDGVTCLDRTQADLSQPDRCAALIREMQPKAVINAAAYTAVDKAEQEEDLATMINGAAPGAMAAAAAEQGVPFVHISTDYVFDGTGHTPWQTDQATGPLSAYGRSKLAGETAIAEAGGTYAILRTSWVFSGTGSNFVKAMLVHGAKNDSLGIVDDQIGAPTYAPHIADACLSVANALKETPEATGIYHFAGDEDLSWAAFARTIHLEAGITCTINKVTTEDYFADKPDAAKRPLNSRLDCQSLQEAFGIARPSWLSGLRTVLADMRG